VDPAAVTIFRSALRFQYEDVSQPLADVQFGTLDQDMRDRDEQPLNGAEHTKPDMFEP
jgi:hypothetical protein